MLQGGGALGSYQAGAYAALHGADYDPDWIAGISIGSVNAAIIAGNAPDQRVEKLREFWELVSSNLQMPQLFFGDQGREFYNRINAGLVAAWGVPGFFKPHNPFAVWNPFYTSSDHKISLYDTTPLKETLLKLIDFDRLNNGEIRLSAGAVNVKSGNFIYFDSKKIEIKPEHIMASGALPEGFPPIEIDGEWYWDGGLVSNTPLQYVIDEQSQDDMCIFQVDLFSAQGKMPEDLSDVSKRISDIRYSSRTRLNTKIFKQTQEVRHTIARLLKEYPGQNILTDKELRLLKHWSCDSAITIAHLIYRQKDYELHSKDYEFSRLSVNEYWQSGEDDVNFTLQQPEWINRTRPTDGVKVFDFKRKRNI
ncbi:MAG: patatin-like phospholipase family protein [Limnobacter sp.]|uniref:patatin-like phospholipase family protein n=1 Tax=Limnobacter sp. TaxID=2003368 RepID=UPI0030034267